MKLDYEMLDDPPSIRDYAPLWCRDCQRLEWHPIRDKSIDTEFFCGEHDIDRFDEKILDCPRVIEMCGTWRCMQCTRFKVEYENGEFYPICDENCPYFPGGE